MFEEKLECILKEYEQKELYAEALERYRSLKRELEAELSPPYSTLAQCCLRISNAERALGLPATPGLLKEELNYARLSGNSSSYAQSLFSASMTYFSKRELEKGMYLLEEAKRQFERENTVDHLQGQGWYWIIKADLANKKIIEMDAQSIEEAANRAIEILTPIENWPGVKRALEAKITLYEELNDERGKLKSLAQMEEIPSFA